MAKLINIDVQNTGQKVLVYGAPKSGKTELVGQLSSELNLLWFDLEHGFLTLKKLPREYQGRIELLSIPDTKDNPVAIDTMMRVFTGKLVSVCEEHGAINCASCKLAKADTVQVELSKLGPDTVVVVDSLTQLSDSAMAYATKGQSDTAKVEFKHYDVQGIMLRKVLSFIQQANYHVAFISHEVGIELDNGSEKVVPAGGTKNFSRSVAKYFDHIVHCSVKNRKHTANSSSVAETKILTGSRTAVAIEKDPNASLLALFKGTPPEAAPASKKVSPLDKLSKKR